MGVCVRDLEVCLDPVDLSEGGGGTPLWPARRVCVWRPWVCLEGRGTRCVSSWPVDSIGRVWGHLPPTFLPFLFYFISSLNYHYVGMDYMRR